MICPWNSRQPLIKSDSRLKPITTLANCVFPRFELFSWLKSEFSLAESSLLYFSLVLIGFCDYFGFGLWHLSIEMQTNGFFYPFVCILTQVVVWVKRVRQCSALSIKGIRVFVIPVYKTDMNVNVFIVGVWILRDSYIWSSTPHIKGFLEYLSLFLLAGNVSCERFNLVCQILLN